jgi:hypothetical protein
MLMQLMLFVGVLGGTLVVQPSTHHHKDLDLNAVSAYLPSTSLPDTLLLSARSRDSLWGLGCFK